jgi:hypothetical protein
MTAAHDPWPGADLGPVARLRVLAAGLPGAVVVERTIDAPFERAWGWIADLERSVPAFDRDVAELTISHRDGDRLAIVSRLPWWGVGLRVAFDVDLRPGWCWMVARNGLYVVGMAAEPLDDDGSQVARTRYAQLEGLTVRGPGWVQRLARPALALSRGRHRRHVRHDVDGVARGVSTTG